MVNTKPTSKRGPFSHSSPKFFSLLGLAHPVQQGHGPSASGNWRKFFKRKTPTKPTPSSMTSLHETIEEASNQVPPSNFFSRASNFTVNNSRFYSVTGGSINFHRCQTKGHPEFPGLLQYEDLELESEFYKGIDYRLHSGRAGGRAVAVKVFQGPRAKESCSKTFEFSRSLMHPNILRIIGGPNLDSQSWFLVFDGDYRGTVESQLNTALKQGIKEGCVVGFNTVVACSLGLSYLQDLGLSFQNLDPKHFVLMLSKQGRMALSFDADVTWDPPSDDTTIHQLEIIHSNKATEICYETHSTGTLSYIFFASSKKYYADQRSYFDDEANADLEDDDGDPRHESEQQLYNVPGQDALPPSSENLTRKTKGHRRELVWKSNLTNSASLQELGQDYQASLAQIQTEDVLAHRRGHSTMQIAHRCPGYKCTKIILRPDIERSGIVSHISPVPNEICSVCGEKVGMGEVFECLCGLPENNAESSLPTVKCVLCSRWQHLMCMNCPPDLQLKDFICWRCPGNRIDLSSTTPAEDKKGSKERKASPFPNEPTKGLDKPVIEARMKRPLDFNRQCGVIKDDGLPCSRSLTCKAHSMVAKRDVVGRSRGYDELLLEWHRTNNPNFVEPVMPSRRRNGEKEKLEKKRLAAEAAAVMSIDPATLTKKSAGGT